MQVKLSALSHRFFLALSLLIASSLSFATSNFGSTGLQTEPEFLPVDEAYQFFTRVEDNTLLVDWVIADEYYLYHDKFNVALYNGQSFEKFNFNAAPGKIQYDEIFEKDVEIHYQSTLLEIPLAGGNKHIIRLGFQGCADAGLCYPPQSRYLDIDLKTGLVDVIDKPDPTATNPSSSNTTTPSSSEIDTDTTLIVAMLLAMIGGAVLNLMPCVFPVLSIKALSLANSHASNHKQHMHGWFYTAGCVATFVIIAATMLILRAGGEAIGWGFQLQSPFIVALLAYLFFIMGLGLSGFIQLGQGFMGVGQKFTQGNGLGSSFSTGVLASVVASPCTAPFMGTALGYAITQPPISALLVFAALGFGMALPFLLISYIPRLAEYFPKPGAWMETFKQALAFPLYLAAAWLIWVLGHQAGSDAIAALVLGMITIVFALWLVQLPGKHSWLRRLIALTGLIIALMLPSMAPQSSTEKNLQGWQAYSPETLDSLRTEGQPVFVNLTADWCITCLANDKYALSDQDVIDAFEQAGITRLKGDWTNHDARITDLLNQYNRSGVPLYLYYPVGTDSQVQILPQLLTPQLVLDYIAPKDTLAAK